MRTNKRGRRKTSPTQSSTQNHGSSGDVFILFDKKTSSSSYDDYNDDGLDFNDNEMINDPSASSPSVGGDDEEEEECGEEEECEIDWSKMPGMSGDEGDGGEQEVEPQEAVKASIIEEEDGDIFDDDFDGIGHVFINQDQDDAIIVNEDDDDEWVFDESIYKRYYPTDVTKKMEKMRIRLEMQWQAAQAAEECDIMNDPPSCGSEQCHTCKGKGTVPCRFCRGTGVLWMRTTTSSSTAGNSEEGVFQTCPICQSGMETCRDCKGTGWIAKWTKLQQSQP